MATDTATLLDRVAGKASAAEAFTVEGCTTSIRFGANELESVQRDTSCSRVLRVLAGGRLGLASSTDPRGDSELAAAALAAAAPGEELEIAFPGPGEIQDGDQAPVVLDDDTAAATPEDLIEFGRHGIAVVLARHPELSLEARISRTVVDLHIENTSGLAYRRQETAFSMMIMTTLASEDDLYRASAARSGRSMDQAQEVPGRLLEKLEWGATRLPPPGGHLPVVFLPEAVPILITPLLAAASGASAATGASPLVGCEGTRWLDPRIELTLDPFMPLRMGSGDRDLEGTPTRRRPLFAAGEFQGFYHDLISAARCDAAPTGNGRRGPDGVPLPSAGNVELGAGDLTLEQMIGDIEDGLLVEALIGSGTGNVLSGVISGPIGVAYRVQSGAITGRTQDAALSGQVRDLLGSQLHSLGSEQREVGGLAFAPPIRVDGVKLSS